MLEELNNKLKNKETTSEILMQESLEKIKEYTKHNIFVTINNDYQIKEDLNTVISKIPYAISDNFSTKEILSTASSNALKDYIPFFDATVIKKLKDNGAVNIGKTTLDEFGIDAMGINAVTGPVINPAAKNRITGGSASGAAAAVSANIAYFAIASDSTGGIRKPASYTGVIGYKPTYGLISRYGLFPFASSFDTPGVITKTVKDAAIITDLIKGQDENDMTTWDSTKINLTKDIDNEINNKRLFYIKEICDINNYINPRIETKETLNSFLNTIEKIKELGVEIEEISLDKDLLNLVYPISLIITSAEATSNMSNLTGLIFGPRAEGKTIEELMINYRTKSFSSLIKERFIIGSYVLNKDNIDDYLLNAGRVRALIVNKLNSLFKKYDGMILPSTLEYAPKINEELPEYLKTEQHLALANFGGFPSISIPSDEINYLPIGINITGKIKDDANILNIANKIEKRLKKRISKEVK
ncbi:MAG: amidase family protein [Bacilli bacterium]|nr:amidase family protein [Bacilli bacterium]